MNAAVLLLSLVVAQPPAASTPPSKDSPKEKKDTGLPLGFLRARSLGPAITSGRVVDFAVHPNDRHTYYVAVASGGVWKTTNSGTTWTPIFDNEGSYSIGVVTLDPKNPNVVWVGTGENNSQRSVAYGDGVYKSLDGGKSWANVGLKTIRTHRQDPHRPARLGTPSTSPPKARFGAPAATAACTRRQTAARRGTRF